MQVLSIILHDEFFVQIDRRKLEKRGATRPKFQVSDNIYHAHQLQIADICNQKLLSNTVK